MLKYCKQTLKAVKYFPVFMSVMAHPLTTGTSDVVCRRLGPVMGADGKQNDVIMCRDSRSKSTQHVIYFGGDVQDYTENMEMCNKDYTEWNLESTAKLLHGRFPNSTVFVIKPSEMLLQTFSIYRNFLLFDEDGRPEFSCDFGAIVHLVQLYNNARSEASLDITTNGEKCEMSEKSGSTEKENDVSIRLVGFSKGCVVINQLVFELPSFKDDPAVAEFLERLSSIYWLDGGHIGRQNAYITDTDTLRKLSALGKELVVHVSPYQIKDVNRRWIGREEREFVTKLEDLKANITEFQHFLDEPGCLTNHWKVLTKI